MKVILTRGSVCSWILLSALVLWAGPARAQEAKQGEQPSTSAPEKASPPRQAMTDTEVYHYLLKRTGCVRFAIDASTFSFGTGWILDLPNRLMVTNLHVVDIRAGKVEVWFPDRDKSGEVIHDAAHYFQNVKPIPATVIWTDRIRDLGLIQLDSLPDGLEEVPLAPASTVTGQQLFSLAGKPRGSEGLWIFSQGDGPRRLQAIDRARRTDPGRRNPDPSQSGEQRRRDREQQGGARRRVRGSADGRPAGQHVHRSQ